MNKKKLIQTSKFLSMVLRHAPETIGLELDEAGWTAIDTLLQKMKENNQEVSHEQLLSLVETSDKKRFAVSPDGTKIRANQGHSIEVNHGFKPAKAPAVLYHGTGEKSVEAIREIGILKMKRHHVHLSGDKNTAMHVGQRHGKPIVLEINAQKMQDEGHIFYLSGNGVWLTDNVPAEYILQSKTPATNHNK